VELIVLRKTRTGHRRLHFGAVTTLVLLVAVVAAGAGLYRLGLRGAPVVEDPRPDLYRAALQAAIARQQAELDAAIADGERHLDALGLELGQLKARLIRLDALGERLVSMADLDPDEFHFGAEPGMGGPDPGASTTPQRVPDFLAALTALSARLDDRAPKLDTVEGTLMDRKLQAEVRPAGRPIESGWLSSRFGMRTDPLTGRRARHDGVDFAGRRGTKVLAVASGVVVYAGRRSGFGRVVEVHHGNGYTTRYAHNSENLVTVGRTVRKGDPIALVGATGRATGTHVHFEVRLHGKAIDPLDFVKAR
jgi:murein DD-endopeptidase MepM/ murein hydrolase activator NlpD